MVNFEEGQSSSLEKKPERSREQKEFAERFNDVNLFYSTEALDLVLVSEGVKPASSALLWKGTESEEEFQAMIDEITPIFEARGLPYALMRGSVEGQSGTPVENASFVIGRTNEELKKLSDAYEIKDFDEQARAFGAAFGYPETVRNFIAEEEMEWYDFPDNIVLSKELHLMSFRMTKEHWREEIATLKEWAEVAKEACPDLYDWVSSLNLMRHFINACDQNPDVIRKLLRSNEAMGVLKQSDKPLYDQVINEAKANSLY
jgi:hypothetical protein